MFRSIDSRTALAVLLLLLATPSVGRADQFRITSGTAIVSDSGRGLTVAAAIAGEGFSTDFVWRNATDVPCVFRACAPGEFMVIHATLSEPFVQTPPVENEAVSSDGLAFAGDLRLAGPAVLLPALPVLDPNDYPVLVDFSGPFVFSGTLRGYRVLDVREPQLLFTADLWGEGTVTMTLLAGPTTYSWLRTEYNFEPVPEPATALFVGSGLVAAWAGRRRYRRCRLT